MDASGNDQKTLLATFKYLFNALRLLTSKEIDSFDIQSIEKNRISDTKDRITRKEEQKILNRYNLIIRDAFLTIILFFLSIVDN